MVGCPLGHRDRVASGKSGHGPRPDLLRPLSVALSADRRADKLRLSDIEPGLSARGRRGADLRPGFKLGKSPAPAMGYRNTKT
jgi:hypothetical protein